MSEGYGSPGAEPGIGRRLRQARETRGLSLRRVEEITKIRARYLEELERENFDVLPTVYVLGSLRTYADFLGLDGAALSRELKESLEPDEAAVAAGPGETDDEAVPAVSIGFDHLFVGLGVVIVSVLALMTLVSAVARYEEPKVSRMNEPSVQGVPPEMALTGNANPERVPQPRTPAETDDEPEPRREDDANQEDREEKGVGRVSSTASLFGDVKFVPMSPALTRETPPSDSTSASAASASAASASAASASASPAPPVDASPVPEALSSVAPDWSDPSSSASAVPVTEPPDYASVPPAPASGGPARGSEAAGADAGPTADAGGGLGAVRPSRGGTSGGWGGAFSPRDVADAGKIQAGVDGTLSDSVPGR